MSSSGLTNLSQSRVYAFNTLSTAAILAVPANTSRSSITFHNPGSVDAFVFPANVLNPATGTNVPLAASLGALGGTFKVPAGGTYFMGGSPAKQEWHAFSASGSGNPLTASEE